MRAFKLLVLTMILSTLGISLGAEVFGKASHGSSCEMTLEASSAQNCASGLQIAMAGADHPDHDATNCGDPCHVGKGHFGHGNYMLSTSRVHFVAANLSDSQGAWVQPSFAGPCLDGLRRPPKTA